MSKGKGSYFEKKPVSGIIKWYAVTRLNNNKQYMQLCIESEDSLDIVPFNMNTKEWYKDGDNYLAPGYSEYSKLQDAGEACGISFTEDLGIVKHPDICDPKIEVYDVVTDPSIVGYHIVLDIKKITHHKKADIIYTNYVIKSLTKPDNYTQTEIKTNP